MAYCTKNDPKVVMVCPTRKTATFFFQPGIASLGKASGAASKLGEFVMVTEGEFSRAQE
jgi:hypothetical protein